jgi:hypothetical protein
VLRLNIFFLRDLEPSSAVVLAKGSERSAWFDGPASLPKGALALAVGSSTTGGCVGGAVLRDSSWYIRVGARTGWL